MINIEEIIIVMLAMVLLLQGITLLIYCKTMMQFAEALDKEFEKVTAYLEEYE